jgi:glutathione peroxidase
MKKSEVVKGPQPKKVFECLSNKNKNGWNDKAPEWNFSKYLIDEQGLLMKYFAPAVLPQSSELTKQLK